MLRDKQARGARQKGKEATCALVVLGTILVFAGCRSSGGATSDVAPDDYLEAIEALEDENSFARLAERSASNRIAGSAAPSFVVDPGWPKTLPNNWRLGQVGGLFVDDEDNVWVYHRPRSLTTDEAGLLGPEGTDELGNPVSGLGHPRPYGPHSECCIPAPSVLMFDRSGDLLRAWGGPSDPGFIGSRCREEDGCVWPAREHGIHVDHNGFVYISGNGTDFVGQFPWAADFGDDSHVLKFTADGEFIYQIGFAGAPGPDSNDIDGGPNGTPQVYQPADMVVDPESNRLYIADGYGNRRVLIVDAASGVYVGHFGAYGQNPVDDEAAIVNEGTWMSDYHSGEIEPLIFRRPVHCVILANDGLLYVCDRGNNRIQVFDRSVVGAPCENSGREIGRCGYLGEIYVAPETGAGTAGSGALSTDAAQSCIYVGDLTNNRIVILQRSNLAELATIGRAGRQIGEFHWLHAVATDSEGNIYTGEVDTASRVQRWLKYGESGC